MSAVPIDIFFIGKTAVDRVEARKWLKRVGVSDGYELPPPGVVTDRALLIGLAGKRCYKSFEAGLNPNVQKIRSDWGEYLNNILASGHGSVLEHAVYTFAFEGVSRVFTGEMNRHRAGWAISEASMRYIRFGDDVPYWLPDSIKGEEDPHLGCSHVIEGLEADTKYPDLTIDQKKQLTRRIMAAAFQEQSHWYGLLEKVWVDELKPESKFAGKKAITSLMRRIIGMGCATGGVWTGNIRAVRHVITMRASSAAEEEILHVFTRVAKMIVEQEPMLFGDFIEEGGYWVPKYIKV